MDCKVYDNKKLCFSSHFTVSKLWFRFESQLSISNVQLCFRHMFPNYILPNYFRSLEQSGILHAKIPVKKSDKNVQVKASLNMGKWEWSSISEIISRMRRRNLIFRGNFSDFRFPSDFTAKITKYFVPVRWISWLHPNWISRRLSGNMKIETYATANYINLITFYNV